MKVLGFLIGLEEEDIPFCMEDEVISLIQPFSVQHMFIPEETIEYKTVKGYTTTGFSIIFLSCRYNKKIFWAQGYVINKGNLTDEYYETFDSLKFSGEAIDIFFPPKRILNYEPVNGKSTQNRMHSISAKPFNEISKCYDLCINSVPHKLKLSINYVQDLKQHSRQIGEVKSNIIITPETAQSIENISDYYLYALDFFRFVNYRNNIRFDKIELIKDNMIVCNVSIFTRNFNNNYTRTKYNSIVFEDISEHLDKLFSNIAVRREKNIFDDMYLPNSDEDFKSVDYIKYLSCALSFEGEFQRCCKSKFDTNELFNHTKTQFSNLINDVEKKVLDNNRILSEIKQELDNAIIDYKEEQLKLLSKKKAKRIESYFDNFKNTLDKVDFTLEEKFNFMIRSYNDIFNEMISHICSKYSFEEPQNSNLGKIFSDMRNKIGHGNPTKIEEEHVLTFQLARCMIYVLILDSSEIEHVRILEILKKMF